MKTMTTPKKVLVTAATGFSATAFWARPVYTSAHDEVDNEPTEPLLLLRLCDFIAMLYGVYPEGLVELSCTIVEVTQTPLYELKDGMFTQCSPDAGVRYNLLYMSYSELLLLMLQIHYFLVATKITAAKQQRVQNHQNNACKLLMTRKEVIDSALRQYSVDIHELRNRLYDLEYKTTHALRQMSALPSSLSSPSQENLITYMHASFHLSIVLQNMHLLAINIGAAPSTFTMTFLSAVVEGFYVYHYKKDAKIFTTKIQKAAMLRWDHISSPEDENEDEDEDKNKNKDAATPTSDISSSTTALPSPTSPPVPPSVEKTAESGSQASLASSSSSSFTVAVHAAKRLQKKKQKKMKDIDAIKALQRSRAAEARARALEEEERAQKNKRKAEYSMMKKEVHSAVLSAVASIEARAKEDQHQHQHQHQHHHQATRVYLDGEPHMWCTWNECLCHQLRYEAEAAFRTTLMME